MMAKFLHNFSFKYVLVGIGKSCGNDPRTFRLWKSQSCPFPSPRLNRLSTNSPFPSPPHPPRCFSNAPSLTTVLMTKLPAHQNPSLMLVPLLNVDAAKQLFHMTFLTQFLLLLAANKVLLCNLNFAPSLFILASLWYFNWSSLDNSPVNCQFAAMLSSPDIPLLVSNSSTSVYCAFSLFYFVHLAWSRVHCA